MSISGLANLAIPEDEVNAVGVDEVLASTLAFLTKQCRLVQYDDQLDRVNIECFFRSDEPSGPDNFLIIARMDEGSSLPTVFITCSAVNVETFFDFLNEFTAVTADVFASIFIHNMDTDACTVIQPTNNSH
jgi:hypothetical protein